MQELQALGYRMVVKKFQLCTSEDTYYLDYQLRGGKMSLYLNRIATIIQIPPPKLS